MPRGQKSKLRAREKRRQARGATQSAEGGHAIAAEESGSLSSSSPPLGRSPYSSLAPSIPLGPRRAPSTTAAAVGALYSRAVRGAEGQDEGRPVSSEASQSSERSQRDPLACRVSMLLQVLLQKYKLKEPITKGEMMKVIKRRYKEHFPEILKRATEHVEVIFGLDLKEVDSQGQSYTIVSKLEITKEAIMRGGRGFPRNGILLPVLGLIYASGDQISEEEMWEFLNMLGIYDGKRHFIFGDPKKLITKDLVQEEYLDYQQVPNTDPPRYDLLLGPRAKTEANKMKVMQFLDRINDIDSNAFQSLNEKFWEMWMRETQTGNWQDLVLLPWPMSIPE